MIRKLLILNLCFFYTANIFAQIGIGTPTPNPKTIIHMESTSKGVLFPRMNTVQRNAIVTPPDGLHIFNTDDHCLNYFDSANKVWNCYCSNCATIIINITSNACKLNFYDSYAKDNPAKNYLINISSGVIINGCNAGDTAFSFSSMPSNANIIINNNGTISGGGGAGGNGTIEQGCSSLFQYATAGKAGGPAFATRSGVHLTINNSGIVAGGGGGGGGSGGNPNGNGGGGGGGAGNPPGGGGIGGGLYSSNNIFNICAAVPNVASPGTAGQATTAGTGGAGAGGGAAGGNGGVRGQAGTNGTGNFSSFATGGPGGKAVSGGSGNNINNLAGGTVFGTVD
jgi:hypothetical protein